MKLSLKEWNERQKILRNNLEGGHNFESTIALFLEQHAVVHSSHMLHSDLASFADEIWEGLSDSSFRRIPKNEDYSIAWVIWHMARIEDMTMNVLVAGTSQLIYANQWIPRLKCPFIDTGNAMNLEAIILLSQCVEMDVLREYRIAVGRRTREIVESLTAEKLLQKVKPERIQKILDDGAVVPEAKGIADYWSRRTIAGLLLMPPTRHNMVHINQALRIKKRSN